MAKQNHAAQIAALNSMHGRAAAWLADVPFTTLRNSVHALPPNSDGTYDGRQVVEWAAERRKVKLDDDDDESLLRASEAAVFEGGLSTRGGALRLLKELRDRHGRQVDSNFVDVLLGLLEEGDAEPDRIPQASDEELLLSARAKYNAEHYDVAERRLEVAVVCEYCEKVRCGSQWRARELEEHEEPFQGSCPACREKRKRRAG